MTTNTAPDEASASASAGAGTGARAESAPGARADSRAAAHVEYLTRLGDNALVLGQRMAEWCGHAPALEEDLALTNISLDLIGQARLLLTHACTLENAGRDEDALAFQRDEAQFRNWTLVELPNGNGKHDDFALTIVRGFLYSAIQVPLWQALANSSDSQLAAIAAKSIKEARAHFRHTSDWTLRLGDGTDESHRRAQSALERLWPYTNEWWAADPVERAASSSGFGVVIADLKPAWDASVDATLAEATLERPKDSSFVSTGKLGVHSEFLGYLLAEMQTLARQHPGARW